MDINAEPSLQELGNLRLAEKLGNVKFRKSRVAINQAPVR
jgi:hypothetical protein